MKYNLTENQKKLLQWIVNQIRSENLPEEFTIAWVNRDPGYIIFRLKEKSSDFPEITEGMLDILADADFLHCRVNMKLSSSGRRYEASRVCTVQQKAFDAIDSNFQVTQPPDTQITIGAIIQTMSGGNLQATGIAQEASISQIINDPELLQSQLEALTENLLDEVKSELKVDQLAEYTNALQELREQALEKKPNTSLIQHLIRTLGFLGDIEGTISLMTRVWPYLHPILLIIASKLN